MTELIVAAAMAALFVGGLLGGFWLGRDFECKRWMDREDSLYAQLIKFRLRSLEDHT